jgi:hypothetical protein
MGVKLASSHNEDMRLWVSGKRVLKRIFGRKEEPATNIWRNYKNERFS